MTSKKDLGSMPFAEVKSVPVFFSECIAARTAWTMATQDTSEKTARKSQACNLVIGKYLLTDDFCTHGFRFLCGEGRGEATGDDVH